MLIDDWRLRGCVIDPAQQWWVITHKGPQHIRVCDRCNQLFYSARLLTQTCRECWYVEQIEAAEQRFKPLSEAVEALGWKAEVWQTGGMVMCLAGIPGGKNDPYVMWSDPDESPDDYLGFCVYLQEDPDDGVQDLIVNFSGVPSELTEALQQLWEQLLVEARKTKNDDEVTIDRDGLGFALRPVVRS